MVTEERLDEHRETVQKIIDKYLPEDKRFSVKNLSEEWLYYIVSYFLEKDEKKRKKIWNEMHQKRLDEEEKFKKAEHEFLLENLDMLKEKEKYDNVLDSLEELGWLVKDIDLEAKINEEMNEKQ